MARNIHPCSFLSQRAHTYIPSIAAAFSVPVLAATISFVTYTATAHDFDVAIIFSSLSLFQLLRQPLMFLPRSLSATTDAQNALIRLAKLFHADTKSAEDAFVVDEEQKFAVDVRDATFEWEESKDVVNMLSNPKEGGAKEKKDKAKATATGQGAETPKSSAPFQVKDVTMAIPRGMLVAIVGSVGSGKVLSVSNSTLVSSHTHRVEFAARSHRRDAQDQGSRLLWRPRCVLLPDSLDPKRNSGMSRTTCVIFS